MLRSPSFKKLIAALFGFVSVTAAAIYFGPWTLFSSIQESAAAISEARGKIQLSELAVARGEDNAQKLADTAPLLQRIDAAVLHPSNALPFIETIESLGKQANVNLSTDVLGDDTGQAPSFRLTALGKISDVLTFLRMLENAPVFVGVSTLTFDRVSPEEVAAVLKAQKGIAPPEAQLVVVIQGLSSN